MSEPITVGEENILAWSKPTGITFGEKAVGLTFNPGGNKAVGNIKKQFAFTIDTLEKYRKESEDSEVKRMLSIAITEAQTAQMWAVKAVTWNS